MRTLTIWALRAALVLLGAGTLVGQIVILPAIGRDLGEISTSATVPFTILAIAVAGCFEVALLATWVLLGMVGRDVLFATRAFRWVDTIIGAAAGAALLLLGIAILVYLEIEPPLDAPGLVVIALGAAVGGGAFVLLMFVMRGLLRKATELQAELDEVV